jgi:hypothetical protein
MLASLLGFALIVQTESCPIQIRSVTRNGLAVRITAVNQANFALDEVVAHVTFNDGLGTPRQRDYRYKVIVQPTRAFTFVTPPITGVVVNFGTVDASFTCRPLQG